MAKIKLLSYADFEIHAAKNEWISNDDFDQDAYLDDPYFRVDTAGVISGLNLSASKILDALGTVAKEDVELRHIERNAYGLRFVTHGQPKNIFFTGLAGVGKSSLFNALLNMPGLAKTGAKGGTCFVQIAARTCCGAKGQPSAPLNRSYLNRHRTCTDFISQMRARLLSFGT
jgi:hypothetical protein